MFRCMNQARGRWSQHNYIACVSLQLSVPSSLNLLPGQIHMLREVVEKEKERRMNPTTPADSFNPYVTLKSDMPRWVLTVLISSTNAEERAFWNEQGFESSASISVISDSLPCAFGFPGFLISVTAKQVKDCVFAFLSQMLIKFCIVFLTRQSYWICTVLIFRQT